MTEAELQKHWKQRKRRNAPPPPDPPSALPTPTPASPRAVDVIDAAEGDVHFSARQAQCIALRIMGNSTQEIADELGISKQVVANYLFEARKKARLQGELHQLLTMKAAPLAVDNLVDGLIGGDKDYTLATLNGLGHFRNHSQVKGEGGAGAVQLQVAVVLPPGVSDAAAIPMKGQIVGIPRAELTEETERED